MAVVTIPLLRGHALRINVTLDTGLVNIALALERPSSVGPAQTRPVHLHRQRSAGPRIARKGVTVERIQEEVLERNTHLEKQRRRRGDELRAEANLDREIEERRSEVELPVARTGMTAEAIRNALKDQGIKVSDLARDSGVGLSIVYKTINGESRNVQAQAAIAAELGLAVGDVFGCDDDGDGAAMLPGRGVAR